MSADQLLATLSPEQQLPVFHPVGEPSLVLAGAGSGKCLTKGTPVMLSTGEIRPVEDIREGDLLMGPDSKPRRVLALGRGRAPLYRIVPTKGDPWGCNADHILVLTPSGQGEQKRYGSTCLLSMDAYLRTSKRFKRCAKLRRVPVDFPAQAVPLDPYFLGLWLGDGDQRLDSVTISKPDLEVRDYLESYARSFEGAGLSVQNREKRPGACPRWVITTGRTPGQGRTGRNPILSALQGLYPSQGRHIPAPYLRNTREVRLSLLAGLVDSDGHISKSSLQVVAQAKAFADDIAFLCRSLGLAAYVTPCLKTCTNTGATRTYHSVSISGNLSVIPTRIPRKAGEPRQQIKDVLRTGFSVTPLGVGDYYGFELDGDGQFLLGDFTVTHNTRVMTARVHHMLNQGLNPRSIAVITFTNKAADELRHRLGFGDDPKVGPRVSTIHSLALNAIRIDPRGFGLATSKVTPLDEGDQKDMLRRLIENRKKDPKFHELDMWKLKEKMGYHRARGVGFAVDYTPEVHKLAEKAHRGYHAMTEAEILLWKDYEEAKTQASVVDFDDMLHLVVRRGQIDDVWRSGIQRQFRHVLMDEAQDTNPVQWQFVEMLLDPNNHSLCAVGDLSQSIYAFSGAAPEILGGMTQGWRGVVPTLYKLEDNYRSLGKVVRFANRIQKTMTGTVPLQMNVKRLEAEGYEGAVTLIREGTDRDIAERIAETIARDARLKTGKFKFRDNALLVRSASQIPALEDALVRCRIPYIVRGGQGLFQTEEARDLFAYLKLVVNPSDVVAFKRAVSTPKRGLGDVAVEKLQKTALAKFEGDLVRAAQNSDHMVLRPFGDFIGDLGRFENPVDALHKLISRIDYRGLIRDRYKKNPEAQERKLENLDRILEAIKGLVESAPNGTASFADIIFRVTMDSKAEAASDDGVVVISTIHNAKGLEWPRVYVTNVYEGSLPHQWSSSEKEVEEERRLFYVAVTRARDVCGLCVPTTVSRGPNVVRVQPSRFLVELGIIQ